MAQARRPAGLAPNDPVRRLRLLGAITVAVFILGTAGYIVLEDWPLLDAVYMTLNALTTVGFGEVRPLDTSGRMLTIGLLVSAVAIVATTAAFLAQLVQEGGLGERGRRKRMQKRVDEMKDHYIVCGFGRVGWAVVKQLEEDGARFVVVDRDMENEERFLDEGIAYEIGDATQEFVLVRAGLERAKGLVCALPDDPDNVFIALAARSIKPDITIVARVTSKGSIARLQQAGVNHIVSPYETSGRQMALAAMERA